MTNWVRERTLDGDFLTSIESIDDIQWFEAELPGRWHICRPQTRGWIGATYVERCACGASRYNHKSWTGKNETRKQRTRDEKR